MLLQQKINKMETKVELNMQTFNIKLATQVSLTGAILIDVLMSEKLTSTELDGVFYKRVSFEEIQTACPYMDKVTVNETIKLLMQGSYIQLFTDIESATHKLILITDKCKHLVDSCNTKPRRKKVTKEIDVMGIVASYDFDKDESTEILKWIDYRAATYGVKKTEQSIRTICNNLLEIKQNGYNIPVIIKHVIDKENWENIKPMYVYRMQKEMERLNK